MYCILNTELYVVGSSEYSHGLNTQEANQGQAKLIRPITKVGITVAGNVKQNMTHESEPST